MRWTRRRRKTGVADPPSPKLRRDWYQDHRVAFAFRSSRKRVPRRCTNFGKRALDAPTLMSSLRGDDLAGDGSKKARSPSANRLWNTGSTGHLVEDALRAFGGRRRQTSCLKFE